jgi:undecaprenyl-diphosphatase
MTLLIAIILGLIQGLTEFLPVSSTAHLTLAENLLLHRSMPLAFDVLLHVGTLVALIVYFRKDLGEVLLGFLGRNPEGLRLGQWLLVGMVPTVIFGFLTRTAKEWAKDHLWVYGLFLLVTAVLLYTANERSKRQETGGRDLDQIGLWDALSVGSIQGLGGGFGLSRSGSTICVGVFRGLKLPAATRFSFLLGIPTIIGAATLEGWHIVKPLLHHQALPMEDLFPAGSISPLMACVVGVVISAISGYFAIGLLDRFTRKPRLAPFAFYCLCVGALLLILGTVGPEGLYGVQGVSMR